MSSNWQTRLTTAVNIGVIVLAVVLVGSGPVRGRVRASRNEKSQRTAIQAAWPDLAKAPRAYGDESARIAIVEFGDYECPACASSHAVLADIASSLGISIAYVHYPLSDIHPQAVDAARASICAESQGAFRAMHNYLYEHHDEWAKNPQWAGIAAQVGVPDTASFRDCLISEATSIRLATDLSYSKRFRLRGTPSYVGADGRIHYGKRPDVESFKLLTIKNN